VAKRPRKQRQLHQSARNITRAHPIWGRARVYFLEQSARRLTLMREGQLADFLHKLRSGAPRECARTPYLAGWLCVPEGPQVQPCHSDHGSGAATIQQHIPRRAGAVGQKTLVPLIATGDQRRPARPGGLPRAGHSPSRCKAKQHSAQERWTSPAFGFWPGRTEWWKRPLERRDGGTNGIIERTPRLF